MNKVKYAAIASAFSLAMLAGCSDTESGSFTEPGDTTEKPSETKVDVIAGCEEISDEDDKAEM